MKGCFGKFFKKERKEVYLALDIGRQSVKALIFRLDNRGNRIEILGFSQNPLPQSQAPLDSKHLTGQAALLSIEELVSGASGAIKIVSKHAKVTPGGAILGVGGEFIKTRTATYSFKRTEPEEKIDLAELKNLVQKAEWRIFDEIKSSIRGTYFSEGPGIKLINAELEEILIDGYKIEDPLNFSGKEVRLKIFNSFCDKVSAKVFKKLILALNLENLAITSTAYATAKMILTQRENLKAILIDIGAQTTEVSIIKNNALLENFTFNIGGESFTRSLARNLEVGIAQAEQIKQDYAQKKVSSRVKENIKKILVKEFRFWVTGVGLGLEQSIHSKLLPTQMLLYGAGALLPGVQRILGTISWRENLSFPKTPVAKILYPKDIKGVLNSSRQPLGPQHIPVLALAAFFVNLQKRQSYLAKILRQAMRVVER